MQGQLVGQGKSQEGEEEFFFAFLTFLRPNFFLARLDFSTVPLTDPGSPRMLQIENCC